MINDSSLSLALYYFIQYIPDYLSFIELFNLKKLINIKLFSYIKPFPSFANPWDDNDYQNLDNLIKYGFKKGSIEYSLKYDNIEQLEEFDRNPTFSFDQKLNWSPFEWSQKPRSTLMLDFCCYFGSIKCFKFLLVNGCRISGFTLYNAICSGSTELINLCSDSLRENDLSLYYSSKYCHMSIMEWLACSGNKPMELLLTNIRCLLITIKSAQTKKPLNSNILQYFIHQGNNRVIKHIIPYIENINGSDNEGNTPLHSAIEEENEHVIELLINHDSDLTIVNFNNLTPLDLAMKLGNQRIIDLLTKKK